MNSDIMSARQQIILRVLRGLVAFAFVLFGTLKLIGIPMMVDVFDHVGLGQWFRYATGGIEVGGAILLLSPRFVGPAALRRGHPGWSDRRASSQDCRITAAAEASIASRCARRRLLRRGWASRRLLWAIIVVNRSS